jgi:hypothetical protein
MEQSIFKDTNGPDLYDEDDVERLFIHIVSSELWEVSPSCVWSNCSRQITDKYWNC